MYENFPERTARIQKVKPVIILERREEIIPFISSIEETRHFQFVRREPPTSSTLCSTLAMISSTFSATWPIIMSAIDMHLSSMPSHSFSSASSSFD